MNTLNREDLNIFYLAAKTEISSLHLNRSMGITIDGNISNFPENFILKTELHGHFVWLYICTYGIILKANLHQFVDISNFKAKAEDLFDMVDSDLESIQLFLKPVINDIIHFVDLSYALQNGCLNGDVIEGNSYRTLNGELVGPLAKRRDGRFIFETRVDVMNYDVDGRYLLPGSLARASGDNINNIAYNDSQKLEVGSEILLANDACATIIEKACFSDGVCIFKSSKGDLYTEKGFSINSNSSRIVSILN